MAWRIYIQNPSVANETSTSFDSTGPIETRKIDLGPGAVTLYQERGSDWWYECKESRPQLPGKLSGNVTKITFMGAPPTQDITPGLYEDGDDSASVEPNGDKLKVELFAGSIERAWKLWRQVLKNDGAIRTVVYKAAA